MSPAFRGDRFTQHFKRKALQKGKEDGRDGRAVVTICMELTES